MNWNMRIRQIHRWLSIAFTVAVILNMVAMMQEQQAAWVGLLALFPLILLLLTGLYMFVLPYVAKWRGARMPAEATAMKRATGEKSAAKEATGGASPSELIDGRIKELGDWRGEMLARIRGIIKQADPDVVEEWKWRGVPVWSTTASSAPARPTRRS